MVGIKVTCFQSVSLFLYPQTGETALHLASDRGHVEVVDLLVKAKADLNVKDQVRSIVYYLIISCIYECCDTHA